MKLSFKEIIQATIIATIFGVTLSIAACSKEDEEETTTSAATPAGALVLSLSASCDGDSCL